MARKKYEFDSTTLPLSVRDEYGKTRSIHGVYSLRTPKEILFCRCGAANRAQFSVDYLCCKCDGFVCTGCGHSFTSDEVMVNYYSIQDFEFNFLKNGIEKEEYRFSLQEDVSSQKGGSKITLVRTHVKRDPPTFVNWTDRTLWQRFDQSIQDEIIEKYRSIANPDLVQVLEYCKKNNIKTSKELKDCMGLEACKIWMNFHAKASDENERQLVPLIMDDINRGLSYCNSAMYSFGRAGMTKIPQTFAAYERLLPDYMLPLDAKVIKDTKPFYESVVKYNRYEWPKITAETQESMELMIHYYRSGLLPINSLQELIQETEILMNPGFARFFKAYYPQASTFIQTLKHDGCDLKTHDLNLKETYYEKNLGYFEEYGMTQEQIATAVDAANGNYLDLLINLGKTRRKSVRSK